MPRSSSSARRASLVSGGSGFSGIMIPQLVGRPVPSPGPTENTSTALEFQDKTVEERYNEWFYRRFRRRIKAMVVLSALFIVGVSAYELQRYYPEDLPYYVATRLVPFLLPAFSIMFLSTAWLVQHHTLYLTVLLFVLCNVSTVLYALLTDTVDVPVNAVELIIIVAASTTFLQIPYRNTAIIATSSCVFYSITAFVGENKDEDIDDVPNVRRGLWVALTVITNVIFVVASRQNERAHRQAFLHALNLERDVTRLKKQLKSITRTYDAQEIDLESPVEKAILAIRRTMASARMSEQGMRDLSYVMHVLGSQNLHAPNISEQIQQGDLALDSDTEAWVFYELAAKEKRRSTAVSRMPSFRNQPPSRRESHSGWNTPSPALAAAVTILTDEETNEMNIMLEMVDSFGDFDVFRLAEITHGRPLLYLGLHLMRKHGLMERFNIPEKIMANFLITIEDGYRRHSNAYHNQTHAADVLHSTHCFLSMAPMRPYVADIEVLAALLAAIIHDHDHPGVNNNFHVMTSSPLALTYNDRSVLENHHVSSSFIALRRDENNIFRNMSEDEYRKVREIIIDMVLATDISMHFDILSTFKAGMQDNKWSNPEQCEDGDNILLLKMLLKCADISNPSKPPQLHDAWRGRVMEEFYLQGDKERANSLPVQPFMNRQQGTLGGLKGQYGFINFICFPLFESFVGQFLQSEDVMAQITANKESFQARLAELEKDEGATPPNVPTVPSKGEAE